jgi:hypothetical protein
VGERRGARVTEIRALAVDPSQPDVVYAGSWNADSGEFKTTDGRATLQLGANGMPNAVRQRLDDLDFGPGGTLYAASHHGIYALSLPSK